MVLSVPVISVVIGLTASNAGSVGSGWRNRL